jgi:hypothetical protein
MTNETDDRRLEGHVRRLARKHGYQVCKSRDRSIHFDNHGDYMLLENNAVVLGGKYDATLGQIEEWLR